MSKLRCFLSRWTFRLAAWLAPEIQVQFTGKNGPKDGDTISFDGGPKFRVKNSA
jgi:hypothetical protein